MPEPTTPESWDERRRREREEVERHRIESGMAARIARAQELPKHQFLPLSYLVSAMLELRHQFYDGNWYGSILLSLGLADGLTKHVAACHGLDPLAKTDAIARANNLQHQGVLSPAAYAACVQVWGDSVERGHYMHFNASLETDPARLEQRARAAVLGVHALQADLFACDVVK